MNLTIVSGPEATGKTAVGKEVARILGYKYQSKDMIKEALFDSEPHNTWDYSWYENKAKDAFFDSIGQLISKKKSAVIESNFTSHDKMRLDTLINSDILISEIYCRAQGMTSFKRFIKRNESGARHKGHHDRRWYGQVLIEDLLGYVGVE